MGTVQHRARGSLDEPLSNITQIATGGGYTQLADGGGNRVHARARRRPIANRPSHHRERGGELGAHGDGAVGHVSVILLVNDTPTSPLNPVVGWLDHGSAITMATTDTYTIPSGALFTVG